MQPKATIGISFKNPGTHFTLALKSVFAQSFTDWELILVDDGSTDGSLLLAKSLQDSRVRVYSDGESKGLNIRLNQLIDLAASPYFIRMDADDIMHPDRLAVQYEKLMHSDNNTVVGSSAYSLDQNSKIIGFRKSVSTQKIGFSARLSFIHPTVAASVEWFRKNPYSTELIFQRSEDAELWCRTTLNTKFLNFSEPLLYYRESTNFSFANYLATSLGLLQLIVQSYSRPSYRCFALFSMEMLKLWIVFLFFLLGISGLLVSKRYKKLSIAELNIANDCLDIIQHQELPIG